MDTRKATIIGLGYVGLPLSLIMWDSGYEVFGLDVRQSYVDALNSGCVKMAESFNGEPIESVLSRAVKSGRYHVTTDSSKALDYDNQKIIMTVGIPLKDNKADTTDLENALVTLSKHLRKGALVVARSTLIVGYTRSFVAPTIEKLTGLSATDDIDLAFSSERMAENVAFEELIGMVTPVAGLTPKATKRAVEFLTDIGIKDVREASCPEAVEAAKVFENIARDVNIALANEYANFCTAMNLDTKEVLDLVRTHKRVGFLHTPGPGVGGHCLPQAMYYLKPTSDKLGVEIPVISTARKANVEQPAHVAKVAFDWCKDKGIARPKIGIIGLAMKDYSTDARWSPAVDVLENLMKSGADVWAYDPVVDWDQVAVKPTNIAKTLDQLTKDCDVIIIGAKQPPMPEKGNADVSLLSGMKRPGLLLDCRFAFDRNAVVRSGLDYRAL
jgi:UDP-N-acetyl-D-mannosaminuronic acid dehydrogenase